MISATTSATDVLRSWRLRALNWVLRGQIGFWLLALIAGVWNALQTYRQEALFTPNPLWQLTLVIGLYSIIVALMTLITFRTKLGYRPRVFTMLGIFYFTSILEFCLSALSGDARGFLFSFVLMAAVFLDMPYNLAAQFLALISFALMGGLTTSGLLMIPAERQLNAADSSAWISGGVVFALLSTSVSLAVAYLLRSFADNLKQINQALKNEQQASAFLRLLSEVNQLIVREHAPQRLFDGICQMLLRGGYAYAWIGKLHDETQTLEVLAQAGAPIEVSSEVLTRAECALQALHARKQISIFGKATEEICQTCPLLPSLPQRATLALPIQRASRIFGVLVVARPFGAHTEPEINLLQELADDLAYALVNIESEAQHRDLAETAATLLTMHDEAHFWPAVLNAVRSTLRVERAAIYLYNYTDNSVICTSSVGFSQEFVDEMASHFRESPVINSLHDIWPVSITDTPTTQLTTHLRQALQCEGIRSSTVFPFYSAYNLLGSFVAHRNDYQPFTQSDLEVGQTLAHLIGTSLQSTRHFTEMRTKATEQAELYAAAQDMASSLLKPQALLETLASHLASALDATSVYIISISPTGENLIVLAEYWGEAASLPERKSDLGRIYQASDYPIVVQSMRSGKSLVLQATEPGLTQAEQNEYREYGSHSKLFVPLLSQGQIMGYAEIWESRRKREFSQNQINLAQAMASYAANVIHTTSLFAELEQSYDATLAGWARALELRDKDTGDHTRRVTELAVSLARTLNLPEDQIIHIRRGAILHDIGKVIIPDPILNKPGDLTFAEQEVMHQHPQYAYEMLSTIPFLHPALDIPYCHHEKWDGTGYPRGLKKEEIPLSARIFSVVDVFDALSSDRPYRKAWDQQKVLAYLREQSGSSLDPQVVEVFLSYITTASKLTIKRRCK